MKSSRSKIKAIALVSTGLDSLLAAKIVKDLGIDVHGVCFLFQFDRLAEKHRSGTIKNLFHPVGIPLDVVDISEDFLPVLLHPQHGYGSGINPCIDCHLFMLQRAAKMMDPIGARFLITGEVVGQRPMSQNKPTLFHIDKVSGLKGLILRPLSAKLLPPTLPEKKGWVNREKLYEISGRSRTQQIDLARRLGITQYNAPAGGCILTDPNFSRRARILFAHRTEKEITVEELKLLRLGRQFWPESHLHVVVGRDEKDNLALEPFRAGRWVFSAADTRKSPLVIAKGVRNKHDLKIIAQITARYCTGDKTSQRRIHYQGDSKEGDITVRPISETKLEKWRV